MKWHEVVTHDDARASMIRSQHRREAVERAKARRRRLRWLLTLPALIGVGFMCWAVFTFDPPLVQTEKIAVGMLLVVPWLATFDWLGEAPR